MYVHVHVHVWREPHLGLQVLYQSYHGLLEPSPSGLGPLGYLGNSLRSFRPHLLQKSMLTG